MIMLNKILYRSLYGIGVFLVTGLAEANDRFVLNYDRPATDDIGMEKGKRSKDRGKSNFIKEALPLGNGRLGAMFSGGIDAERLLINEITCWALGTSQASGQ